MHRNTKVTPLVRKEIFALWKSGYKVQKLANIFRVSRKIIYKIIHRGKVGDFSIHKSTNHRFKSIEYGLKHLKKAEIQGKKRLARRVHRYEKEYPGEMVHFDTKSLRRAKKDDRSQKPEYLFVAIDDRSRQLFAKIIRARNQVTTAGFLESVIELAPYKIECAYSDNGKEFKGNDFHNFVALCDRNGIDRKYTRAGRPQTNGKAERVIRTIMDHCDLNNQKRTSKERKRILKDFLIYYNSHRPHSALTEGDTLLTPCQVVEKML